MYSILILPGAAKQFSKLNKDQQRLVGPPIFRLSKNPRPPGVKKLKGKPHENYRIRIGNFRVLFGIDDGQRIVTVLKIADRKMAYG